MSMYPLLKVMFFFLPGGVGEDNFSAAAVAVVAGGRVAVYVCDGCGVLIPMKG